TEWPSWLPGRWDKLHHAHPRYSAGQWHDLQLRILAAQGREGLGGIVRDDLPFTDAQAFVRFGDVRCGWLDARADARSARPNSARNATDRRLTPDVRLS